MLLSCRGLVAFCVVLRFCVLVVVLVGVVLVIVSLFCSFVGSLVLVWWLVRFGLLLCVRLLCWFVTFVLLMFAFAL